MDSHGCRVEFAYDCNEFMGPLHFQLVVFPAFSVDSTSTVQYTYMLHVVELYHGTPQNLSLVGGLGRFRFFGETGFARPLYLSLSLQLASIQRSSG